MLIFGLPPSWSSITERGYASRGVFSRGFCRAFAPKKSATWIIQGLMQLGFVKRWSFDQGDLGRCSVLDIVYCWNRGKGSPWLVLKGWAETFGRLKGDLFRTFSHNFHGYELTPVFLWLWEPVVNVPLAIYTRAADLHPYLRRILTQECMDVYAIKRYSPQSCPMLHPFCGIWKLMR